jgi:hypothetical protein
MAPPVVVTDVIASPVLELAEHARLVSAASERAIALGKLLVPVAAGPAPADGVFTLAAYQTPFKTQNDRGTCWAFAGVAALEAAYRRKFGTVLDMSEEYTFHIGKAFALTLDANGFALPVENNSSITGFQGSGDIVEKICENAIAGEDVAPYIASQGNLLGILPTLGYAASAAALTRQEDYDALEFCEQHIPLIARINARYRGTDWAFIGNNPGVTALENTLLSNHEVVCDVSHLTPPVGGHVLTLIGFDRNRKVFFAKNHWGENKFIEIQYSGDPNWTITSGYYIKDVVDSTFVQSEACWLGNWWLTIGGATSRLILRRAEDFNKPKQPTKVGTLYAGDGKHDVNGMFLNNGTTLRIFVGAPNAPVKPGTLAGTQIDAQLDFTDIYNLPAADTSGRTATLSRFATRYAAIWQSAGGSAFQARHGLDASAYQQAFDQLHNQGMRPVTVAGYSEGRDARFAAVWIPDTHQVAWEARHQLTAADYQTTFTSLANQGYRLTDVSGYALNGSARYIALWEKRAGPDWQAHHGMTWQQYQQMLTDLNAQGYVLTHVSGYRVGIGVQFAGIWEKQSGVVWQTLFGLTASQYQKKFDEMIANGMRLSCVSGYADSGIARYAAIWRKDNVGAWQARHGLDAAQYQTTFTQLAAQGMLPVQISGYGDGFYPA